MSGSTRETIGDASTSESKRQNQTAPHQNGFTGVASVTDANRAITAPSVSWTTWCHRCLPVCKSFMWYKTTMLKSIGSLGSCLVRLRSCLGVHWGEDKQRENAISNGVRSLFALSQCVPFSPAWWFCTTPSIYGARGGTWGNFCWVCAAGLSEPLPHYSLFCGQNLI